jgi:hypothetical protein
MINIYLEIIYKMAFKMLCRAAWVERSKVLLRERGKAQALEVELQNCLIKISECFARANIGN